MEGTRQSLNGETKSNHIQIVVAHHNENIGWLSDVAPDVVLYVKGERPAATSKFQQVIMLPNIGRESHTFLHHIASNYDVLADVTLFLQGCSKGPAGTRPHTTLTVAQMRDMALKAEAGELVTFASESEGTWMRFDKWAGIDWQQDPDYALWLTQQKDKDFLFSEGCTPAQFWHEIFGYDHPERIMFASGALFAVRAETIRLRPPTFYKDLLRRFTEANHVNPEIGHFVEAFWGEIFHNRRMK